jgi:hypothetical protein
MFVDAFHGVTNHHPSQTHNHAEQVTTELTMLQIQTVPNLPI